MNPAAQSLLPSILALLPTPYLQASGRGLGYDTRICKTQSFSIYRSQRQNSIWAPSALTCNWWPVLLHEHQGI